MSSALKPKLTPLTIVAMLTASLAFAQGSPQTKNAEEGYKPTILRRAGDYSQEKRVVVILVSKGYKEELHPRTTKPLTWKDIGNAYAHELFHKHGVKVVVMENKETRPVPYTVIIYFVDNRLYGPHDLEKAEVALPTIANTYDVIYKEGVYKKLK